MPNEPLCRKWFFTTAPGRLTNYVLFFSFFQQPTEQKQKVAGSKSKFFNGYTTRGTAQISPTESRDNKEGFMWRYDPKYDPVEKPISDIPGEVQQWLRGEDFVWEGTSHLPSFQEDTLKYWASCLTLARALVKVFAICQDLPENYFDELTTYPGADGVYNYYPALSPEELAKAGSNDVGLGSHTDLQCFTLLWQDQVGGLQVLNNAGQWIKASPIPGTFVVNIGDFLKRMTNDKFQSTVHRVYNRATVDRLSMPFFFGFNFNDKCSVLPTCTDEMNPPKYEPISCGEVRPPPFPLSQTVLHSDPRCSGVSFVLSKPEMLHQHRARIRRLSRSQ